MSATRKAKHGYFYIMNDFVTWYGSIRGTQLWEEAEPTARQAGVPKQRLGLFPRRLPFVAEEPRDQTSCVSVLPPLPADIGLPPGVAKPVAIAGVEKPSVEPADTHNHGSGKQSPFVDAEELDGQVPPVVFSSPPPKSEYASRDQQQQLVQHPTDPSQALLQSQTHATSKSQQPQQEHREQQQKIQTQQAQHHQPKLQHPS